MFKDGNVFKMVRLGGDRDSVCHQPEFGNRAFRFRLIKTVGCDRRGRDRSFILLAKVEGT